MFYSSNKVHGEKGGNPLLINEREHRNSHTQERTTQKEQEKLILVILYSPLSVACKRKKKRRVYQQFERKKYRLPIYTYLLTVFTDRL